VCGSRGGGGRRPRRDLDWAHTNAVTARAEADTAENVLRAVLAGSRRVQTPDDETRSRGPPPAARITSPISTGGMQERAALIEPRS